MPKIYCPCGNSTLKINVLTFLIFLVLISSCSNTKEIQQENTRKLISLVDPFIGTGGHGHTFPGASLPFGMVQLSPDNGTEGWDWSSGYHYSDSLIAGFSHTHLSGTGIGDYADISFMPFDKNKENLPSRALFSHANESASPGFYQVKFNNGISTALTVGRRIGVHRYDFPEASTPAISIDLGFQINWDSPTQTHLTVFNQYEIGGYRYSTGWAKDQRVYFYARFDQPFDVVKLINDKVEQENNSRIDGQKVQAILSWNENLLTVGVKVGISSSSIDAAKENLDSEDLGLSFEQHKMAAEDLWEKELSRIVFNGIEAKDDTIFYSALYHSMLAPVLHSDVSTTFKGADGQIHKMDRDRYTVFSLWDTFRALHPLFTLIVPEKNIDFLYSMLTFYKEYGLLPVWDLSANETNTMTGYHAIPVIADAILKGQLKEDLEEFYQAMLTSAAQDIRGTNYYREYGYIPSDLYGWSVTKTLEYAFDDWCIAQVAKHLGDNENYEVFMKRAGYYKNLFDSKTGFMRAKDKKGDWVEPFDPFYSEHGFDGMYVEGTAWQHTWFVPHDVEGLIELYNGREAFIEHLSATFEASSQVTGENVSADITGLIGQYAHGNEPSHHIPYLFTEAGRPDLTQMRVRQIMENLYSTGPEGLPGNEDCGQMSAWYVFNALGFYPMNPADGYYLFGSPQLKRAKVSVGSGRELIITAHDNAPDRPYISEVRWNGIPVSDYRISHATLEEGGHLEFFMSSDPSPFK